MTEATPSRRRSITELDQLEQDIAHAAAQTNGQHPPRTDRHEEAKLDNLAKMSAEAVLQQYEATAKAIEVMGTTVTDIVKRLGASMIECDTDLKFVAETAAAIREKGKHTEALIEQAGALSKAIRETCEDFKKKVDI